MKNISSNPSFSSTCPKIRTIGRLARPLHKDDMKIHEEFMLHIKKKLKES